MQQTFNDWKRLKKLIQEKRNLQSQPIAAFDADGTLWNTDLGEALFAFQVKNRLIKGLPADPWAHYENLKKTVSYEAAYLWLAQINEGLPLEVIRGWAQEAVAEMKPVPIFSEVKRLIDWLLELKVEVYIVTASIQWAVEPGAPLLGLPSSQVIGIKTKVMNGLITAEAEGAITYREGKVKGLLERTKNQKPFFCAGNTEGDLALLESSTSLKLVVSGSPQGDRNFDTEQRMLKLAKDRDWESHRFSI